MLACFRSSFTPLAQLHRGPHCGRAESNVPEYTLYLERLPLVVVLAVSRATVALRRVICGI